MNRKNFECINGKVYSALANSCLFCFHCNEILVDYKGPYKCYCSLGLDDEYGIAGKCDKFEEDQYE